MIFKLITTFLVGVFKIGFTNGFTITSVISQMSFTHDVSLRTDSYDYNDTFGSGHDNDHDYSHGKSKSKSKSKSKTKPITNKIKSYSSKKTPKSISISLDDEYDRYEEDEYDNTTGIDFNSLSNISDTIYTDTTVSTESGDTTVSTESDDTTVSTESSDTTVSTESDEINNVLESEAEQTSDTSMESGKKSSKHISKVVIPVVAAALSMFIVALVIIRKEKQKRDKRDKPVVKKVLDSNKSSNQTQSKKKRDLSKEQIFDQKYEDSQGYLVPSVKRAKYDEATKFNESKESKSEYALAQHYEVPDSPEYDFGTNGNIDDSYYEVGDIVNTPIYDNNNQISIESTYSHIIYNLPNNKLKSNQGSTYYSVATNTEHPDVTNETEYDLASK